MKPLFYYSLVTGTHPATSAALLGTAVVDPIAPLRPTPSNGDLWGECVGVWAHVHPELLDEFVAVGRVERRVVLLHHETVLQGLRAGVEEESQAVLEWRRRKEGKVACLLSETFQPKSGLGIFEEKWASICVVSFLIHQRKFRLR